MQQNQSGDLSREELRRIVSMSLWAGQLMLQHGADTARVQETIHHISTGLGSEWVDVVVHADSLVASSIYHGEFRTRVRNAPPRGINIQILNEINNLSHRIDAGDADIEETERVLRSLDTIPSPYPEWMIVGMVGIACGAFSQFWAADVGIFVMTALVAMAGYLFRRLLTHNNLNFFITIILSAIIVTLLGAWGSQIVLGQASFTVVAASLLFLVPGVQLLNAWEDLFNGHIQTGIVRGALGLLISFCIGLGISLGLWVIGIG